MDIGGHSLKLAQLAGVITGRNPAVDVSVKDLLADTSLVGMARVVEMNIEDSPSITLMRKAWREVLQIRDDTKIASTEDFMDIGGHSLKLAQLAGVITAMNPSIEIPVKDLLADTTLMGMARAVNVGSVEKLTKVVEKEFINLPLEASLETSIYPAASRKGGMSRFRMAMSRFSPRRILLTGGTGYLGAFILYNLAVIQNKPTYALVRAKDADAGRGRLVSTLRKYGLLKPEGQEDDDEDLEMLQSFVVPVCGDLQKPLLGMESEVFKVVAGSVDAVIHCAADVNLFKNYQDLKKTNVLGTQECLRITVENGLMGDLGSSFAHTKAFIHISSNGVFPSNFRGIRGEDIDLNDDDIWKSYHDGYGQSKWVAEKMVHEAGNRGVPIMILRPGNMAADSKTGVWNADDFYSLFLRAVIELGVSPVLDEMDELGWEMDLTPVDWAAEMIVKMACEKMHNGLGSAVHIQNGATPVPMSKVMKMLKTVGFKIGDGVPMSDWVTMVDKKAAEGESEVCGKVCVAMDSFAAYFATGKGGNFSSAKLGLIFGGSANCPSVDAAYLKKALGWLGVAP